MPQNALCVSVTIETPEFLYHNPALELLCCHVHSVDLKGFSKRLSFHHTLSDSPEGYSLKTACYVSRFTCNADFTNIVTIVLRG